MAEDPGGALEWDTVGEVTVIRVRATRLWDDAATDALFDQVYALIEDPARHKFVLDVGAIEYLASAALGKLVTLGRKVRAARGRLVLCDVPGPVQRLLQLTHLDEMLLAYDSEREAVRALA